MQRIKKGDTVEIIAGKDIGERGEVLEVDNKKNRVVVSGANVMKRHNKAKQVGGQQVPAQIVDFDAPMHISNVMLVCPSCDERVRVGFRYENEKKVRFCKKCDSTIS